MNKFSRIFILVLITFVLFLFATSFYKSNDITAITNDLNETPAETPSTEEKTIDLQQEYPNTDIVGIINIPNADINEPVVQTSNNDFYLNHDIYKEKNRIGSIYLDYRVDIDTSPKILIFGHNSKTLNPPFKNLEKYYDEEFAKNNREIKIITNQKEHIYEIFSVFVEAEDFSYMNIKFSNSSDWLNHLNSLKNKSWFNLDTELSAEDRILVIQTCSYHSKFKKYKNKYIIIVAKEIN